MRKVSYFVLGVLLVIGIVALAHAEPSTLGLAMVAAAPAFGTAAYWHPIHQQKQTFVTAGGQKTTIPPLAPINVVDDEHPNGILSANSEGFVQLLGFENFRAQCLASPDQKLVALGTSLPHWWSFVPAVIDENMGFGDEQKFNVVSNCSTADMFIPAYAYYWPCTHNSPDQSHFTGWVSDHVTIPDSGALSSHTTLNDIPALCAAMWKRSALNL